MGTRGKSLRDQIGEVVPIPSIASILATLQQKVSGPDASAGEVGEIILQDPATTLKVLRIANSAIYGLKHEVSSIPQRQAFPDSITPRWAPCWPANGNFPRR